MIKTTSSASQNTLKSQINASKTFMTEYVLKRMGDEWRLPLINILDSAAHRNRVTALPTRRLVGLFISSWRARKVKQEFNGVEVVG